MADNNTQRIRAHYDAASALYRRLWGDHIHHGYFRTGEEGKEEAAENLIRLLVDRGGVRSGARVLDVGCGVGGTAIWLASNLGCRVTGVTISPVQARMAAEAARHLPNPPRFVTGDANDLATDDGPFDVVWAVEVISHLRERDGFFRRVSEALASGGRLCVGAWLKDDGLTAREGRAYIRPIEAGMLVLLPTFSEYVRHFERNGLRLLYYEDISARVARTWDLGIEIVRDPALWRFAVEHGRDFVAFLRSFRAIRRGFRSGAFRYAVLVAEGRRPATPPRPRRRRSGGDGGSRPG